MIPSQKCIDLIKSSEGFEDKAYLCPAGIPTIGYGSTMWSSGVKVKLGQTITLREAESLLYWEVSNKSKALGPVNCNQNQFDAIISLIYNIGIGAFRDSTLRRKMRLNPNDPTIRDEFMRWNKSKGKVIDGLTTRRKAEADLYFSN